MTQNPKVFISYSSKDIDKVYKLVAKLEDFKIQTWLDKWSIKVGEVLTDKILAGIKECDYFIIVLTRNSSKSQWVKDELTLAKQKEIEAGNTVIIPLKLDECEVPFELKSRKYADFQNFESGFAELLHFFGKIDLKESLLKGIKSNKSLSKSIKLEKILKSLPFMIFIINKKGVFKEAISKGGGLPNIKFDVVGKSIFDLGFWDELPEKIVKHISKCIETNLEERLEYSLSTQSGSFFYEMRLSKLSEDSVISVVQDITENKFMKFQLEKTLIRAEESDKLKSAFLANLSHEIRTPLNIISNFSRMLVETELSLSERTELADAISQNSQQLLNMMNNTILLSKMESTLVQVVPNFCRINALMQGIYDRILPVIRENKNVKLDINYSIQNPNFGFETDSHLLYEVLNILLDNAIKYTLHGEVNLSYEIINPKHIKFIVKDTGIGIPEKEKKNIFSRFYRISNDINNMTPGAGIGLVIAKYYVSLLEGTLEFDSTMDKGSKFWFSLPFKKGKFK